MQFCCRQRRIPEVQAMREVVGPSEVAPVISLGSVNKRRVRPTLVAGLNF